MPIFEYKCDDCKRIINVLILKNEEYKLLHCPHCRSVKLNKIFSRFTSPKSAEARMESLTDPAKWQGLDENDPKSMLKFMKKMGKEFGEELGEDYDKMMEEAEEEAMKASGSGKSSNDLYAPSDLSD